MEVIIHRGTHQIGGCATEYRTKKTRIFIDFGAELDTKNTKKFDIAGVTRGKSDCNAVFFTHYHWDHIGLVDTINPDIPLYMGAAAKAITQLYNNKQRENPKSKAYDTTRIEQIQTFERANPVLIGDIKITPFSVDHSAYDAYMFLIEADGKRILHTGDFRAHGLCGSSVKPMLEKYVKKTDVLICEGTTLSRKDFTAKTEDELMGEIKAELEANKYVFVLCSATNIDRVAGICSIVPEDKLCLCDKYQMSIIEYVKKVAWKKYPQYQFEKMIEYDESYYNKAVKDGFCMFVRANNNHKAIMEKYKQYNPLVIYSMWGGYLKEKWWFLEGYKISYKHTSGHADRDAIKMVIDTVNPDKVIPIHTEDPEEFADFGKYTLVLGEDNKTISI